MSTHLCFTLDSPVFKQQEIILKGNLHDFPFQITRDKVLTGRVSDQTAYIVPFQVNNFAYMLNFHKPPCTLCRLLPVCVIDAILGITDSFKIKLYIPIFVAQKFLTKNIGWIETGKKALIGDTRHHQPAS